MVTSGGTAFSKMPTPTSFDNQHFAPMNSCVSSSPFPLKPGSRVLLPLLLFPSAAYFAVLACHGSALVDCSIPYDKRRKDTHRFDIVDTRGTLSLTVPIVKPDFSRRPSWDDVPISSHGQWFDKHLTALESAYGRTPYFQFYIDRLRPFFDRETPNAFSSVSQLDIAACQAVCRILGINSPEFVSSPCVDDALDLRRHSFSFDSQPAHYQVRQASLGFTQNLSILDLIFNLGPEAPIYLIELAKKLHF